jgi:FIMAH domain
MTGASTGAGAATPATGASTGAGAATPMTGASTGASAATPATGASTGASAATPMTGASTGAGAATPATGASTGAGAASPATGASTGAGAGAASPTTSNTAAATQTTTNAQTGQTYLAAGTPVKGAATQARDEIALVQASSLPAGAKQSLTNKLTAANSALTAGNNEDAKDNLDAALRYIKAQSGKSIPTTMATQLTADITRIKAVIG